MATLTPLGPGLLQNQALGAGDSVPGLQAHDVSVAMETPASISTCCSCRRPPGREGLAGWREAETSRTLPACGPAPERGPREGGGASLGGDPPALHPAGGQVPRHAPLLQSERCLGMKQLRLCPFPLAAEEGREWSVLPLLTPPTATLQLRCCVSDPSSFNRFLSPPHVRCSVSSSDPSEGRWPAHGQQVQAHL